MHSPQGLCRHQPGKLPFEDVYLGEAESAVKRSIEGHERLV